MINATRGLPEEASPSPEEVPDESVLLLQPAKQAMTKRAIKFRFMSSHYVLHVVSAFWLERLISRDIVPHQSTECEELAYVGERDA